MHIALIPCIVCAAVGAAGGWIVRDREYYKEKEEEAAETKTAKEATTQEGGN